MKYLAGMAFVVVGIISGLYLGLWLLFIGGIAQAISSCQVHPVDALNLAIGIAKVICSGPVGWGIFSILGVMGSAIMQD